MTTPGEVHQAVGRAYVHALAGCLQQVVSGFRVVHEVSTAPEKLTFPGAHGTFSFDLSGLLELGGRNREVWIECKGRAAGGDLGPMYQTFIRNAFKVAGDPRHTDDQFWFVTNVPFNPTVGRNLVSSGYVRETLAAGVALTEGDLARVDSFIERLCVAVLTDSFIRRTGLKVWIHEGDTLWGLIEKTHGAVPEPFGSLALSIGKANGLADVDLLTPEHSLSIPWLGLQVG